TGLGAAVSDALDDGRVVSGVGGQYNFVAMAHALPDARSILCLRSTRTSHGRTRSNIIWSYGHETIPRHLRDIFVTEYGIADLRGKTDREIVERLVGVMDARFQDGFVSDAKRAGKLPASYRVPDEHRANDPRTLAARMAQFRARGLFAELPFGSDFTSEEIVLAKALRSLASATSTPVGKLQAVLRALLGGAPTRNLQPYLERMGLQRPQNLRERIQRGLLVNALADLEK